MRRRVTYAIGIGILISFLLTFTWFLLFGYKSELGLLENLINVFMITYFWIATLVWASFFTIFITIPIAFVFHKTSNET